MASRGARAGPGQQSKVFLQRIPHDRADQITNQGGKGIRQKKRDTPAREKKGVQCVVGQIQEGAAMASAHNTGEVVTVKPERPCPTQDGSTSRVVGGRAEVGGIEKCSQGYCSPGKSVP